MLDNMRCAAILAALLLTLALLPVPISAEDPGTILSPALEVIARDKCMIRSGLPGSGVMFSPADFDDALGCDNVKSVTITALPDPEDGVLKLGDLDLTPGSTVSRSSFDLLRFVPASADTKTGSFTFTYDAEGSSGCSVMCILRITDTYNLAPTTSIGTSDISVWTQTDISCFGTLPGSDPEGDALYYEIITPPKRGLLVLTNATHGDYCYTPYEGERGSDSFTYAVFDEYGNRSAPRTVSVTIDKPAASITFADMDGHWAHNAAIVMCASGVMKGEVVGDELRFNPSDNVTRAEFLVMTMKTLGAKDLPTVNNTGFVDDDMIAAADKSYIAAAYRLGLVKGREYPYGVKFDPDSYITRAEAAVLLNNIIGGGAPAATPVFADANDIPAWAQEALYACNAAGIMRGTGEGMISPYAMLTRAQTAQILMTLKNMK
jgi:hypothetical protein